MREEMEDMRSDIHGIRGDIGNLLAFLRSGTDNVPSPKAVSKDAGASELGGATASLFQAHDLAATENSHGPSRLLRNTGNDRPAATTLASSTPPTLNARLARTQGPRPNEFQHQWDQQSLPRVPDFRAVRQPPTPRTPTVFSSVPKVAELRREGGAQLTVAVADYTNVTARTAAAAQAPEKPDGHSSLDTPHGLPHLNSPWRVPDPAIAAPLLQSPREEGPPRSPRTPRTPRGGVKNSSDTFSDLGQSRHPP
mmetsp:Transcript_18523/g.46705  ORF Transcript_18523/g.46705 Transcript_18523/m.46705 type:complete len:252 (+) Transcript_18523:3-758(+)